MPAISKDKKKKTKPAKEETDLLEAHQKLELINAIDRIRDEAPDPMAMLTSIVTLITSRFDSDLCLLSLIDHETDELELKAINDTAGYMSKLGAEAVRQLASRAASLHEIDILHDTPFNDEKLDLPFKGIHIAALPIIIESDNHLGSMLLIRKGTPFSDREIRLLETIEDHVDSAVVQGYIFHELELRNHELETIYTIDRIRDQNLPFDAMLNEVLRELRNAIPSEMGFIMLYERAENKLELRASSQDDIFRISPYHEAMVQVAYESLQKSDIICYNDLGSQMRSIMCIPLILRSEIIGVFGLVNRYGPQGFEEPDRRILKAIASQMDTAIFDSLERRRLRQVLGRAVGPKVMERMLRNPDLNLLKVERATLTVLYCDIRGSTSLAEKLDPEILVQFINSYLTAMTEVIFKHDGTLDKFVGDEVMALFSAPYPQNDHAERAVKAALEMQEVHQTLLDQWKDRGVKEAPVGIGIATGELIVGEMGSVHRTNYTALGRAANLGARICAIAKGGEVLISEETFTVIGEGFEYDELPPQEMKGIDRPVPVYRITGLVNSND